MKIDFENPELEVILLDEEDVITTSDPVNGTGDGSDGDESAF